MTELSFPIKYFKKAAKALHKQVAEGDPEAITRARAVFTDLAEKLDAEVAASFGLMRAQHVVAVEHGFTKWNEMTERSPVELHLAITMAKDGRRSSGTGIRRPTEPPTRSFSVYWDRETPAHAGAIGMLQVLELAEDAKDVTHLVDQGLLIPEEGRLERLRRLIAQAVKRPVHEIKVEEPDEY